MTIGKRFVYSLAGATALAALVAFVSPPPYWGGWLAASLLLAPGLFLLLTAWQWAGRGKVLAWMIALAFILRLGIGMTVSILLPQVGFDEEAQNAGYLFTDAYRRDQQAWELAQSDEPLWASFREEFTTDQYGGLLSSSAAVYRVLSPGVHRPFLILILGVLVSALGVVFYWQAVRLRWGEKLANLASWMLVLYPDGILFGASQMREPFLVGLIGVAFWALMVGDGSKKQARIALALSAAGMLLISSRVAVAVLGVLALWYWLDRAEHLPRRWRQVGWALLALAIAGIAFVSWDWFRASFQWDVLVTERASGWVTKILEETGSQVRIPFIVGYGLAQPVLPAAIIYPTLPIWKTIAIARAAGWYTLAPLILYASYAVWRSRPTSEKRILVFLSLVVLGWLLLSSARAGGDQWDNPRYRSIFLPWIGLLAAWGVQRALQFRDLWLVRWLVVEAIFLYYFTQWYFSRYLLLGSRLPFWENVSRIALLSALVLGSGWLWDLGKWVWRRSHNLHSKPGN
ncbi:MAG: hypothetical protein U1B80_10085 [Anaerolineaceae bacterium]|nr:hypothetical protein [Anaerolineaceae bacterium]